MEPPKDRRFELLLAMGCSFSMFIIILLIVLVQAIF